MKKSSQLKREVDSDKVIEAKRAKAAVKELELKQVFRPRSHPTTAQKLKMFEYIETKEDL